MKVQIQLLIHWFDIWPNCYYKGSLQKKKTEDLVNSALKEGGYLTWITILNNNEIVKRGRGVEEKDTCKKLKIIMENNSITPNVYIWCIILVQFSLCALKSDKFYDII